MNLMYREIHRANKGVLQTLGVQGAEATAFQFLEWVTKISYDQLQNELQDILSRITLFVMGATEFISRKSKSIELDTLTPAEFAAKVISGRMPAPGSFQALNAKEIRLKKERDKKAKRAAVAKHLADQLAYKKREIEKSLNAQNSDERDRIGGSSGDQDTPRGANNSYMARQASSNVVLTQNQLKRQEEAENLKKEQAMNPLVGVPLYDLLIQQEGGFLGAVRRDSGSEEESEDEEHEIEKSLDEARSDHRDAIQEGSEGEKEGANSSQVNSAKMMKRDKKRREVDPETQLEEFSSPKELSKIILKITQCRPTLNI